MPNKTIDYDAITNAATIAVYRGVMRDVLSRIPTSSPLAANHFYITFATDHPDVILSNDVKAKFPHEMTIVLQEQFWDLRVDERGFGSDLSFNKKHQRVYVPFEAISVFDDPYAEFVIDFRSFNNGTKPPTDDNPEPPNGGGAEKPKRNDSFFTFDDYIKRYDRKYANDS